MHDALVTDETGLIREILCGRRDLFADLIGPHVKPVSHIIQRTIGRRQDVEDIVQQGTLKALIHLAQSRAQASFRTWLVRIGLNEARPWQRSRAAAKLGIPPSTLRSKIKKFSITKSRFKFRQKAARTGEGPPTGTRFHGAHFRGSRSGEAACG
jgi:hypothetical protein